MNFMYEQINFLPEAVRPSAAMFIIIIVGYFISKIGAAFILKTMSKSVAKTSFWILWLGFILLAYTQIPILSSALRKWTFAPANITYQIIIIIIASILFTQESFIEKIRDAATHAFKRKNPIKIPESLQRIFIQIGSVLLMCLIGLALNDPKSAELKILATIFVVLFGVCLAKVTETTLTSILDIREIGYRTLPKVFYYIIFASFLVTLPEIWQT